MSVHDTTAHSQTKLSESASVHQEERLPEVSPSFNISPVQQAIQTPSRATLTPRVVMQLQRSHGNHYVASLYRQARQADSEVQRAISISAGSDSQSSLVIRRQHELYNWKVLANYNTDSAALVTDAFQKANYVVADESEFLPVIEKAMRAKGYGKKKFAAHISTSGDANSGQQGDLKDDLDKCYPALIAWAKANPKGAPKAASGIRQTDDEKKKTDQKKKERGVVSERQSQINYLKEQGCTETQINQYLAANYNKFPKNLQGIVATVRNL